MSAKKLILISTLLVVLLVDSAQVSVKKGSKNLSKVPKPHNFTVGAWKRGEKRVIMEIIEVPAYKNQMTVLERSFNIIMPRNITRIEAIDLKNNGTSATVSLVKFGPGYKNATLRFKGQASKGFNYVVNLYTRWRLKLCNFKSDGKLCKCFQSKINNKFIWISNFLTFYNWVYFCKKLYPENFENKKMES